MPDPTEEVLESGASACKRWARDFDLRHNGQRAADELKRLKAADADGPRSLRQAMALMDFPVFVTALVHFANKGISAAKASDVGAVLGKSISAREYWRNLERARFFAAGYELAAPLGVPATPTREAQEAAA